MYNHGVGVCEFYIHTGKYFMNYFHDGRVKSSTCGSGMARLGQDKR